MAYAILSYVMVGTVSLYLAIVTSIVLSITIVNVVVLIGFFF